MANNSILLSKTQITQWLTDLRSGEFEQGQDLLRGPNPDGRKCYCCLGVLAERLGTLEEAQKGGSEEHVVRGRHVFAPADESTLIRMNDNERKNFFEIANWVEQNILPHAPEEMVPGTLLPYDPEEDYEEEEADNG